MHYTYEWLELETTIYIDDANKDSGDKLTTNNAQYPTKATNQGGYEVATIRVNPRNGRVRLACGCYGYETFNPPYVVHTR